MLRQIVKSQFAKKSIDQKWAQELKTPTKFKEVGPKKLNSSKRWVRVKQKPKLQKVLMLAEAIKLALAQ